MLPLVPSHEREGNKIIESPLTYKHDGVEGGDGGGEALLGNVQVKGQADHAAQVIE